MDEQLLQFLRILNDRESTLLKNICLFIEQEVIKKLKLSKSGDNLKFHRERNIYYLEKQNESYIYFQISGVNYISENYSPYNIKNDLLNEFDNLNKFNGEGLSVNYQARSQCILILLNTKLLYYPIKNYQHDNENNSDSGTNIYQSTMKDQWQKELSHNHHQTGNGQNLIKNKNHDLIEQDHNKQDYRSNDSVLIQNSLIISYRSLLIPLFLLVIAIFFFSNIPKNNFSIKSIVQKSIQSIINFFINNSQEEGEEEYEEYEEDEEYADYNLEEYSENEHKKQDKESTTNKHEKFTKLKQQQQQQQEKDKEIKIDRNNLHNNPEKFKKSTLFKEREKTPENSDKKNP